MNGRPHAKVTSHQGRLINSLPAHPLPGDRVRETATPALGSCLEARPSPGSGRRSVDSKTSEWLEEGGDIMGRRSSLGQDVPPKQAPRYYAPDLESSPLPITPSRWQGDLERRLDY